MSKNEYKAMAAKGLLNPPLPDQGRFQWGIFVTKDVCALRELFCEGDDVRVTSGGALEVLRRPDRNLKGKVVAAIIRFLEVLGGLDGRRARVNLVLPAGKWKAVYLTSPLDGCPVAIHDWPEIGVLIEELLR